MRLNFPKIFVPLIYLTIFLWFLRNPASAQPSQNQPIKFEHLTVEDGLAGNGMWCILQDSKGFLWFGSGDGLSRYDGYEIEIFDYDGTGKLSANSVWSLLEDHQGIIWIGTNGGGLNRYDPATHTFSDYQHDPNDPNSMSGSTVRKIYESPQEPGILWLSFNGNGLTRFDTREEKYTRYRHDPNNPSSLSSDLVLAIYEDKNGVIWLGTSRSLTRVNKINAPGTLPGPLSFTNYRNDPADPRSLPSGMVLSILEDRTGALWVGGNGWAGFFDPERKKFTRYRHDSGDPQSLSPGNVISLLEDKAGHIWFGTYGYGLNRFNRATQTFTHYQHDPDDPYSLSNNIVRDIYEDRGGILWVATYGGGINKSIKNKFDLYRHEPNNPNSLVRNYVTTIQESGDERDGALMVGTQYGGVTRISWRTGKNPEYTHYQHDPDNPNSLSDNYIRVITESKEHPGVYWIGTFFAGLNRLDSKTGIITPYQIHQHLHPIKNILAIHESPYEPGILWIGTDGQGLKRLDPKTLNLTDIPVSAGKNPTPDGRIILQIYPWPYQDDLLWARSKFGHSRLVFSPQPQGSPEDAGQSPEKVLARYARIQHHVDAFHQTLVNTEPLIFQSSEGLLWMSTNAGLVKFNSTTEKITVYDVSSGLPDRKVKGFLEDSSGNLWLSTGNGLSRFNPQTETFRNFDVSDGLQGKYFNWGAFHKSRSGKMYFGGRNGLNVFHPDSIKDNIVIPPIVFTDFQIFDKSVKIDTAGKKGGFTMPRHITAADEIVLSHRENAFSFEFAALDYSAPQKNQYAYQMEGFDEDWIYSGNRRFVTYTNLDAGEYVFRVKGTNNDRYWNEEGASVKVIILPPWWQTTWAYLLYALLVTGTIVGVIRYRERTLHRRTETLEIAVQERTQTISQQAEELREMNTLKSRFFANISHEFRTPLTLILGQIESALPAQKQEAIKKKLQMAFRNAGQLQRLINQLLDLSKFDARQMTLKVSEQNIVSLLRQLTGTFESLALQRKISLQFECSQDEILVYYEQDKIEKVMHNLLSNALKFTLEGGSVQVAVSSRQVAGGSSSKAHGAERIGQKEKNAMLSAQGAMPTSETGEVKITVRDSGIGIPKDRLPHIFDRFYQVDSSATREFEGTGIGLALTKELVQIHGGSIAVETTEGFGTTFTVKLLLGREHLKTDQISDSSISDSGMRISDLEGESKVQNAERMALSDNQLTSSQQPAASNKEKSEIRNPKSEIVLVVEDNPDMRAYIRETLMGSYKIIEAPNGEEGFAHAQEHIPDLIVTDVMMPKVDGYALTRMLREDQATSHIPIIMLTAKAAETDKFEGLETGVDVFLTKPFSTRELEIRVRKLIELRQQLLTKVQHQPIITASEVMVTSVDRAFLERLQEIVEENLSDENFQVEELCREIGMSRRQLQRKLNALLDCSPAFYIRRIRMERAKQLLEQNAGNVTEIAFDVGYGNVSNFARAFRDAFQKSPSEFLKKE